MRGKVAKRLRKEAGYKITEPENKVIGDYNINLGYRILNVPKVEPGEISDIQKECKKIYKNLKKNYNK